MTSLERGEGEYTRKQKYKHEYCCKKGENHE